MNFSSYKNKLISAFALSFIFMSQIQSNINLLFNDSPSICGNFVFDAELLILRPFVTQSDHCAFQEINNVVDADGNVATTINNRSSHNHFKWQPGFRLSFGYIMDACNWKYNFSWMHLNSKSNNGSDFIRKWNFNFDNYDATAGYTFCGNECFSLASLVGIRGAKIDQKVSLITDFNNSIQNSDREKFWGVGPLIGLETNSKIGCDISLYTTFSISWLYGRYDIRLNDITLFENASENYIGREHIQTTQLVCDAGVGLQWNPKICNQNIIFSVGLEHHHYFDYNNFDNGDLSLSGVRIAAGFEY